MEEQATPTPLWLDGPTQEQLDTIKADLNTKGFPSDLFVVTAGQVNVVARIVPRFEYNEMGRKQFQEAVAKKLNPSQADDAFAISLLNTAVVWRPAGFNFEDDKMTACGVIPTLTEKIMELNGFDNQPPRRI